METDVADKFFGPYLSERAWGTVREDYKNGDCWKNFTHDMSRRNVYLHGEDGLLGWCDYQAKLCASLVLWNGKDKILKERLFGLTGIEGNHGEDVKELYYYTDNVPDHSYMRALYRYPHSSFPYNRLIRKNIECTHSDPEYELIDTGVFDLDYWDIYMEFAKEDPKTCLCRYTIHNRGRNAATLYVLPQIWLRDTWSHCSCDICHTDSKPNIMICKEKRDQNQVLIDYSEGSFFVKFDNDPNAKPPDVIFTENEAMTSDPDSKYRKDAFHEFIIAGNSTSVNPQKTGTKCAAVYAVKVKPGSKQQIQFCLWSARSTTKCSSFGSHFDSILKSRASQSKKFNSKLMYSNWSEEEKNIAHQAYAGLLWNKQFYCFDVHKWFKIGCARRRSMYTKKLAHRMEPRRNRDWINNLRNCNIISMPDKWEFPWYATWDLAFHMIPFSNIDLNFTKRQLLLFLSDNYLHPSGQLPAYEFDFSDTNPPVHAWACLHVYRKTPKKDFNFLKKCFHRLMLNHAWWVNVMKIPGPGHLYRGGFLGMDNICVYDRSYGIPPGYTLAQADGTGWMAFFSLKLFEMALELSVFDEEYLDLAERFLNYFFLVANSANCPINKGGLWDQEDDFFYDVLLPSDSDDIVPLCIRSWVGVVPLFACSFITPPKSLTSNPKFLNIIRRGMTRNKIIFNGEHLFLSLISKEQLELILACILKESEFLSPFGIRSLSKHYENYPYSTPVEKDTGYKASSGRTEKSESSDTEWQPKEPPIPCCLIPEKKEKNPAEKEIFDDDDGNADYAIRCDEASKQVTVKYAPGESICGMFGGNSNWRGPIWLCMNYLFLESLEIYHGAYGDSIQVELPTGSGNWINLKQVVHEIAKRIVSIFLPDKDGRRPLHGCVQQYIDDENWRHLVLFYEYFCAETGRGCGASHQTGWTALVVEFLKKKYSNCQETSLDRQHTQESFHLFGQHK